MRLFRHDLPAGGLPGAWPEKAIMPSNLKKLVHARMAKTGESYQAALRQMRAQEQPRTTGVTPIITDAITMSREMPTLFSPGDDACDAYRACRDHSTKEEIKLRFERAFGRHAHLCPEVPSQFASERHR